MALPTSNISVSLVKNTLGESATTVSGLVTSPKVNRWGFNSPNIAQQNKYWQVYNPPAPHELGCFRGYDHYWRCYGIKEIITDDSFNNCQSGYITFSTGYFPSWSTPVSGITYSFDVYFSRTGYNYIYMGTYSITDSGSFQIYIDVTNAPDGQPISTMTDFYIKIKAKDTTSRRWSHSWELVTGINLNYYYDNTDYDSVIVRVTTGNTVGGIECIGSLLFPSAYDAYTAEDKTYTFFTNYIDITTEGSAIFHDLNLQDPVRGGEYGSAWMSIKVISVSGQPYNGVEKIVELSYNGTVITIQDF